MNRKTYMIGGPADGTITETRNGFHRVLIRRAPSVRFYETEKPIAIDDIERFDYQVRPIRFDDKVDIYLGIPAGEPLLKAFVDMLERRAVEAQKHKKEVAAWRQCARRLAHLLSIGENWASTDPGMVEFVRLENEARVKEYEEAR